MNFNEEEKEAYEKVQHLIVSDDMNEAKWGFKWLIDCLLLFVPFENTGILFHRILTSSLRLWAAKSIWIIYSFGVATNLSVEATTCSIEQGRHQILGICITMAILSRKWWIFVISLSLGTPQIRVSSSEVRHWLSQGFQNGLP